MLKKSNEHNNIMSLKSSKKKGVSKLTFECRGCFVTARANRWHNFATGFDNGEDNSYLIFVDEPDNEYDHNAIAIMSKGETYGILGYVGREWVLRIKDILSNCGCYRIDMVDRKDAGLDRIPMVITWEEVEINRMVSMEQEKLTTKSQKVREQLVEKFKNEKGVAYIDNVTKFVCICHFEKMTFTDEEREIMQELHSMYWEKRWVGNYPRYFLIVSFGDYDTKMDLETLVGMFIAKHTNDIRVRTKEMKKYIPYTEYKKSCIRDNL